MISAALLLLVPFRGKIVTCERDCEVQTGREASWLNTRVLSLHFVVLGKLNHFICVCVMLSEMMNKTNVFKVIMLATRHLLHSSVVV